MKKLLKVGVVLTLAVAVFAVVPALAGAGTGSDNAPAFIPPTADTGECQTGTQPTPPPGSSLDPIPGTNSQPWIQRDQLPNKAEAGIKGTRGYLVVRANGSQTNPSLTVQGYQVESDTNGNVSLTPNGTTKGSVCLSAQNQRVRLAVP